MSDRERITRISHQNEGMRELVNRLFFLPRANCSLAHFWAKNERFAQKTDEQIPSPGTHLINRDVDMHMIGPRFQNVDLPTYSRRLLTEFRLRLLNVTEGPYPQL